MNVELIDERPADGTAVSIADVALGPGGKLYIVATCRHNYRMVFRVTSGPYTAREIDEFIARNSEMCERHG